MAALRRRPKAAFTPGSLLRGCLFLCEPCDWLFADRSMARCKGATAFLVTVG